MKQKLVLSTAACAVAVLLTPALAQSDEDTIVVTGSPLERSTSDAVVGVSVLEDEALGRRMSGTLGETLQQVPGISATSFGAGASRPIIRGQGGDRIRILDNGIGSIDASSASPDHAVAVTPAMAERIEIIRGTALLRYGSSGAGGVVNVIDGRLPSRVPEDGLEGAVRLGLSTVNEGREAAGAVTGTIAELGGVTVVGHLDGNWREAEDYDIPGTAESVRQLMAEGEDIDEAERGTVENSFADADAYAGSLSFIGDRGFLAFGVKQSNTTYGVPGHEHEHGDEHSEEGDGVFIELDQTRYDLNGRLDLDGPFEAIKLFAGYADYTHTEFEAPGEPGTVFTNEGYEARLELIQRQRGGWRGASGYQVQHRDFAAIGDEAFVPPTTSDQWGVYSFQEYAIGDVSLEAAARFERTDHDAKGLAQNRGFDGISGSVGAIWQASDLLSVGGTLFRTERAPTTEELYSGGPHLATSQFELGDPTLDEEISRGVEAIFRLGNNVSHATVNLFYTEYDGYIYEAYTGGEEDGLPVYQFTAADAVFQGAEFEGHLHFGEWGAFELSTDLVADIVDADLEGAGDDILPRIPPFSATLGLNAEAEQWQLRAELEHAADRSDVTELELPTDGYSVVNVFADWSPSALPDGLTLSAALMNATDEEVRLHTSFLKDIAPQPGRNLRLSVRYAF
ncbi:TonB-dependent receptor [Parvularcula sp. LCG005]|uniref:TonB-dependent receptor n=1 Tax=Parvularcula sp. LCG005 TaxID=3078805 RepID=UPI002942C68E|nr:TonB-dependent receptor [Parvularcula sp. LCG005]WOI54777.1 TonB-dependent receptor [Parvularcula sp. LCG005]